MNIRSLCGIGVALIVRTICAYEQEGHQTVGAIADIKLRNTAVYQSATGLLHGITFERASILPDQIKAWDRKKLQTVADISGATWNNIPTPIKQQLLDFWKANPAASKKVHPPSHHIFHYTDVSIDGPLSYADAKAGVNEFDIAHMIPYSVAVLKGSVAETNDLHITKAVALILLIHYVGDLHQPLHVGAAYFNSKAQRRAPKNDADANARADTGGGSIYFPLSLLQDPIDEKQKPSWNLHHFWDDTAVQNAYALILPPGVKAKDKPRRAAEELAKVVGSTWTPGSADMQKWTVKQIDRILPEAKEAHDRLRFTKIKVVTHKKNGTTALKAAIGAETIGGLDKYSTWAGNITRQELLFAGLDLTELLKRAFAQP